MLACRLIEVIINQLHHKSIADKLDGGNRASINSSNFNVGANHLILKGRGWKNLVGVTYFFQTDKQSIVQKQCMI